MRTPAHPTSEDTAWLATRIFFAFSRRLFSPSSPLERMFWPPRFPPAFVANNTDCLFSLFNKTSIAKCRDECQRSVRFFHPLKDARYRTFMHVVERMGVLVGYLRRSPERPRSRLPVALVAICDKGCTDEWLSSSSCFSHERTHDATWTTSDMNFHRRSHRWSWWSQKQRSALLIVFNSERVILISMKQ